MKSCLYPLVFLVVLWAQPLFAQNLFCREIFEPSLLTLMSAKAPFPQHELAKADDFPIHSAARIYFEFARQKMLLNQTDPELGRRGLLRPNGGLCASTCMTNVVGAMTAQYENFRLYPSLAPETLNRVVETYNKQTGKDARLGAYMRVISESTLSIMYDLLTHLHYDSSQRNINLTLTPSQPKFRSSQLSQSLKGDSIAIVTVKALEPEQAGTGRAHAIVVLNWNHKNKTLTISDPNYPNAIISVNYHIGQDGRLGFSVPFTYGHHLVTPIEFNTFTRSFHR